MWKGYIVYIISFKCISILFVAILSSLLYLFSFCNHLFPTASEYWASATEFLYLKQWIFKIYFVAGVNNRLCNLSSMLIPVFWHMLFPWLVDNRLILNIWLLWVMILCMCYRKWGTILNLQTPTLALNIVTLINWSRSTGWKLYTEDKSCLLLHSRPVKLMRK